MEEVKVRKPITAETIENIVTLSVWILIGISLIVVMLIYASRKTIMIVDSGGEAVSVETDDRCENMVLQEVKLRLTNEKDPQFFLPLATPIKAESVTIENRYESKELWIYLKGVTPVDFVASEISGKTTVVDWGHVEAWESGALLKLHMMDIYEYRTTLSDTRLTIAYYEPHELYETVVVVDAAAGGQDTGATYGTLTEADISLQVIQQLQQLFEHEQIKVYYTRRGDVDVDLATRAAMAEAVKADAFLSVGVIAGDDVQSYGTTGYYNATYFIPAYGNPQVADALTRNITISTSNKALGIMPAPEESILQLLTMPAARVDMGNLRNEKEYDLLESDAYKKMLAQGIQAAIIEIHDHLHQTEE